MRYIKNLILGCTALSMTACIPLYNPSPAITPSFKEPGELHVAGHYGSTGVHVQAALSLPKHLAVATNLSLQFRPNNNVDGGHAEAAIGVYLPFGIGRFETYGGLGGGQAAGSSTFTTSLGSNTYSASGSFANAFIQSNIGLGTKIVDVGLALRMNYTHFFLSSFSEDPTLQDAGNLMLEPVAFLRLGYKWIKVESQLGSSFALFDDPSGRSLFAAPLFATIGLRVHFDGLFGKNTD